MFLLDKILLFPARGLLSVAQHLHEAVQQESANQAETIRGELAELYLMLETGRLPEAEFDRREKELLDSLEAVEARGETECEGDGIDDDQDH